MHLNDIADLLKVNNKLLKDKVIEVNSKKGISHMIFLSLYCSCTLILGFGITNHFNFNNYISLGFLGLIALLFLHGAYIDSNN